MNIGDNVKKLRISKGYTQSELAAKINVGQSMIAQIERGTRTLTIPLGKSIADLFGCSIEDLYKDV